MSVNYVCSCCGKKYKPECLVFRCECGGMLDLEDFEISLSKKDILQNEWSLFKYFKALPFDNSFTKWKDISMGEGLTPIVPLGNDYPNVLVKVDYLMPTMSFKDRGAVVLISKVKELGVNKIIQDSSGNAGTSIAAYAKRAGIECDIYVPEGTSEKKVQQISSYGANVHIIKGSREDTAKAALTAAENGEGFYASHVYNPFFYQGTKTYVYEVFEQLNGDLPETLVLPVGNGTLVLGVYYGLKDLLKLDLISKMPKIIAIQSENCAPIYQSYIEGIDYVDEAQSKTTLAEGIAIADPKRGRQILQAIRDTKGFVVTAPENNILNVRDLLAGYGFYVEPTTAATFAGYFKFIENNKDFSKDKTLIPLCGSGLKSGH
ncbi:threonine synthase [Proteiniborus sp.]|uniref:threonine synthase n=1 Tax=Proteiniborus sp. TaxID=2079015 RepID=UPI0033321028